MNVRAFAVVTHFARKGEKYVSGYSCIHEASHLVSTTQMLRNRTGL